MHKPTETKDKKINEGREKAHSDLLHDLPDWLQEFRENFFVDGSSPLEPRGNPALKDRDTSSSSHELPMESRAKVETGLGMHTVYTHIPKACIKRAGTVVPKADNFGDLITADHKLLSEESESRNNHQYPVVVQDLEMQ